MRRFTTAVVLVPAALAASSAHAAPTFTEQSEFGTGQTIAVAWGDATGDGFPDLGVGNFAAGQNYLFTNDGAGSFTGENRFGKNNTFAMAWGDYDNDGDLDMAVGNDGAANRLVSNLGGGNWSGSNPFGGFVTSSIALAWADYDLDGDLDMAIGNGILGIAEPNELYRNDGGGAFAQQNQFGGGQTGSLTWGDYDGDGDPDLAVGNGGFGSVEQNYLYVNNGDGTFTQQPEFGTGDTSCLVWGDADNDGDLDVAVANWNGGQNYLYRNDGGSFAALPRFGQRDPNTFAWGDFDDDGDLDLAVGNGDFTSADTNFVYVNEGGLVFTENAQFGLGSTDGVAWADYDLDGDLDLAVGNEHSTTQNYLYINEENDSNWLSLQLVGHFHDQGVGYSNRSGVGAKVTVYDAGFVGDPAHRLGFREICAHGGFAAQNELAAHFGLPGHATVDVRIEWPGSGGSGMVQDIAGVPVPSRAVIHEGVDPVAAPAPAAAPAGAWRVAPNPTRGTTRLEYARPALGGAEMEIVDVTGRLVRTVRAERGDAGLLGVWDGRAESGTAVSPGVYLVRLKGEPTAARVTVVR